MASDFREHITTDGDRWDLLAYRYYGDANLMAPIIAANPHIPITTKLTGGLRLLVPILEEADTPAALDDLPPWKR